MQIEVYQMSATDNSVTITLEAVCDDFSSLLWDVQYYGCGNFEVYIAANERNTEIFQTGKIVGRDDDKQHYGIIETVTLETDVENGDYLTVTGRFLMSLLSRRIIYPTLSFSSLTSYGDIVRAAVQRNCMESGSRLIPGLKLGEVSGECWEKEATLQISYENLMEWIYTICESIGGTANIRLYETNAGSGSYEMLFDLSAGVDRSITQDDNPHMIFSDAYNNLLTFTYASDQSSISNFAYVFGTGEGADRARVTCYSGSEPSEMERYEIYVDAKDISPDTENEDGEKVTLTSAEYGAVLRERGTENLSESSESVESEIVTDGLQYQYNRDYFVGDYVTVESKSFGLRQSRIQLTGMIESFDQNGKGLTPTFRTDSTSDNYGTSDSGNPSLPSTSGDGGHTHDNKDVLDTITEEKIQKWDSASTVTVTRHLKTGTKIATITVDGAVYDVYAPQVPSQEQIDAWTDAAEKAHTHANKEILDATTASYTLEEKEKLAGLENGSGKYLPLSGGALYNGSTLMLPSDDTSYKLILSAESTSYRVPSLVDWDVGERYFANNGTARIGTIGAYGNGSTLYYYYLGTNYNSVCLKVTPDGVVSASKFVGANATQSEQGLMSAADKAKLDGIATGANKTTVDTSLSATSTNPVQNKVVKEALDGKAASSHTHDDLPLSGGTMNAGATIEIPNSDGRSMTLSASNATFKAPSGSWAMGLTYRETDGTTILAQIGAKGTGDTLDYLYFGGTYSAPLVKLTPDGTLSATVFLGDLSGNAASAAKLETARKINGVSFDGTSDITVPLYSGYACDDGAAWSDAPWHKIASTTVTASYQDVVTTMYVTRGQSGNDTSGILRARVRAGSSASVIESASLSWLLAGKNINTQNFIMVCKANSNGGLDIEVWVKLATRYEGWQYYMIGSGYRTSTNATLWKLYQSGTGAGSASHTDSGTVYTSTISQIQNPQSDTGWVSITLGSMFSSSSWLKCRKIDKTVHLQGELCPASAGIPGYTLMLSANLPYPPDTTRTLYPVNRAGKPMQIQLSAGAGITVLSPESGYTTDSSWIIDTIYFTEE